MLYSIPNNERKGAHLKETTFDFFCSKFTAGSPKEKLRYESRTYVPPAQKVQFGPVLACES